MENSWPIDSYKTRQQIEIIVWIIVYSIRINQSITSWKVFLSFGSIFYKMSTFFFQIGRLGPYSNIMKLMEQEHHAHLAVFLTYVLNNRLDPSSIVSSSQSKSYMLPINKK